MQTGAFRGFEVTLHDPGIALIQFNEPSRLNGMRQGTKRDLVETLLQAQMEDLVRVVVFTGSGRAFSAGDDLTGGYMGAPGAAAGQALVPDVPHGHGTPIGTYDALRMLSQSLNLAVRNLDKLSIAAINGVAIQTGLSLALACDFRIAGSAARLGSATLRFGLLPDEGGQYLLVETIGIPKTIDFLMRKRIVNADEALALGLVHEVVPDDELLERTMALARELADGPQVAMRLLKRSVYNASRLTLEQAMDEIASKTALSDHHPDAREGIASFREKRPARFNRWIEERQASSTA